MRALRIAEPLPVDAQPEPNAALAVLREIVGELVERVELLEIRDRLRQPRSARSKAGTVRGRE